MKENRMKRMVKMLLFCIGCVLCFASFEKGRVFAKEETVMVSEHDTRVIPDLYDSGVL